MAVSCKYNFAHHSLLHADQQPPVFSIIGADDGIYEFHVNTFSRKMFPSITMR